MTVITLLEIVSTLSFIAMTAYLTGRSRFIMRCARYPFHLPRQLPLILLFAFLAITGNYSALPWGQSHITTRMIGVILAGIIGGPITGFSVGLIGAAYLVVLEGTPVLSVLFIALAGMASGLLRLRFNFYQLTPQTGAGVALVLELFQFCFSTLVAGTPGIDILDGYTHHDCQCYRGMAVFVYYQLD